MAKKVIKDMTSRANLAIRDTISQFLFLNYKKPFGNKALLELSTFQAFDFLGSHLLIEWSGRVLPAYIQTTTLYWQ
jgi:hypothetical protein